MDKDKSMSLYKHPSWNLDQWETLWPKRITEHEDFVTSQCSVEFQRLWQSDKDILDVMTTGDSGRPVSLASVRQFSKRLEAFMTSEFTEELMSLPPSPNGFHRAIAVEIENNSSTSITSGCFAVALAVLRPGDVAKALRFVPDHKLNNDWKIIAQQVKFPVSKFQEKRQQEVSKFVNDAQHTSLHPVSDKDTQPVVVAPSHIENNKKDASDKSFTAQPRKIGFSELDKNLGLLFVEWVKDAKTSPVEDVQMEQFDGLLKKHIMLEKGSDKASANYWLEDVAIQGLSTLQKDDMEEIVRLWPKNHQLTFNDPLKTVANTNFWRNLRAMKTVERSYYLEEILPKIVNTSDWQNEMKFELLKKLTVNTEKYDWLFEERLKLWLAWGGNLDGRIEPENFEKSSVFASVETTSAREWLKDQKNEKWNAVIEKNSKRKSSYAP